MQGFDIIGDIHGCNQSLVRLLEELDYEQINGVYRHPERQALFLGDFIDRGIGQREVVSIVRAMIDNGAARSVMGNHEYNAIAYQENLRPHNKKNRKQHEKFLKAYPETAERTELIDWFRTLPLWLEVDGIRLVHACWDAAAIESIQGFQNQSTLLSQDLLVEASKKGTWQHDAIETILKGKEIELANGQSFLDKEDNVRHEIRVRFWDKEATTYKDVFLGPEHARTHIPEDPIVGDYLIEYEPHMPPVFLGHYWLDRDPVPLASNIACVDYSVAKNGGKLVAYRWNGENNLSRDNFVGVDRQEEQE